MELELRRMMIIITIVLKMGRLLLPPPAPPAPAVPREIHATRRRRTTPRRPNPIRNRHQPRARIGPSTNCLSGASTTSSAMVGPGRDHPRHHPHTNSPVMPPLLHRPPLVGVEEFPTSLTAAPRTSIAVEVDGLGPVVVVVVNMVERPGQPTVPGTVRWQTCLSGALKSLNGTDGPGGTDPAPLPRRRPRLPVVMLVLAFGPLPICSSRALRTIPGMAVDRRRRLKMNATTRQRLRQQEQQQQHRRMIGLGLLSMAVLRPLRRRHRRRTMLLTRQQRPPPRQSIDPVVGGGTRMSLDPRLLRRRQLQLFRRRMRHRQAHQNRVEILMLRQRQLPVRNHMPRCCGRRKGR